MFSPVPTQLRRHFRLNEIGYNTLARDVIKRQKKFLPSFRFEFVDYTLILPMYQFILVWSTTSCASACKTSTTQNQPHQISKTQRTENKTTDVVIQQHSRKLLVMDILMPETCWAHKKWNKIASDIKLVFHSSTITMMHGPINIRFVWHVSY